MLMGICVSLFVTRLLFLLTHTIRSTSEKACASRAQLAPTPAAPHLATPPRATIRYRGPLEPFGGPRARVLRHELSEFRVQSIGQVVTGRGKDPSSRLVPESTPHTGPKYAELEMIFNPAVEDSPSCLYLAVLGTTNIPPTVENAALLRRSIQQVLCAVLDAATPIAGKTLQQWIQDINSTLDPLAEQYTTDSFVARTADYPLRAGCTLDALIASHVLGCTIWVLNANLSLNLATHRLPPHRA
eukprot:1794392-Amphidinium_carterae.1